MSLKKLPNLWRVLLFLRSARATFIRQRLFFLFQKRERQIESPDRARVRSPGIVLLNVSIPAIIYETQISKNFIGKVKNLTKGETL